jgi:hypothetical protein
MPDLRLNYSAEEIDRRLVKYTSRRVGRIILENRTLRWSTPGTLNDPYDMQFDLHIEADREAVKRLALEKLWDAHYGLQPAPVGNPLGLLIRAFRGIFPQLTREEFDGQYGDAIDEGRARMERALPTFQQEVRSQISRSKILCLSELADSAPMWAYYAEQHQGLVLRFKSVPELDSPWVTARPIQYHANMPRLLDADFLADLSSGRATLEPMTILNRLIYTKSIEWAHEREWHIFSGEGRNANAPFEDIPFHELELEEVVLGCRMPAQDRAAFSRLIEERYPQAQVSQVRRSERDFRLNIVPFALE